MRDIGQLIGGREVAGRAAATATSTSPPPASNRPRRARRRRRDRRRGPGGAAALPAWADAAGPARAGHVPVQGAARARHGPAGAADHRGARQDARRRRGRGQRGIEVVEFACGIPHLLKGEFSRERRHRRSTAYSLRQPLGVCAGITPFNFPAMVPLWMFPVAIACGNTFVLKPSERDPVLPADAGRAARARPACPTACFNVVNGDKEAVDAILDHPDIEAVSFVGSTPIAEYIYATGTAPRQARAGAGRRQEPRGRDARRRPRPGRRRADGRGLRLGRRALHGDLGGGAGRREDRRRAGRAAGAARRAAQGRPGRRARRRDGPAGHRASTCDKVRGYVDLGVEEGAKLVVDGRGFKLQGYENGFFLGGCLFDRVTPEMRIYKEEIFGPVLVGRARADLRRGDRAGQRARVRQRRRDLHPRRRRRARLRRRSPGRHGRRQRADPGADGLPQLRRLEALAVRRPPHARHRRACASTPA